MGANFLLIAALSAQLIQSSVMNPPACVEYEGVMDDYLLATAFDRTLSDFHPRERLRYNNQFARALMLLEKCIEQLNWGIHNSRTELRLRLDRWQALDAQVREPDGHILLQEAKLIRVRIENYEVLRELYKRNLEGVRKPGKNMSGLRTL
jgi:hypothetical protein